MRSSEYSSMSFLPHNKVDLESRYGYPSYPQSTKTSIANLKTYERLSQPTGAINRPEYVKIAKNSKLDESSVDQIDGLINLLHEAERITGKSDAQLNFSSRNTQDQLDMLSALSIID